jgi:hypothetical protein
MCWHCSYSNTTCLPLFTVQSTPWQTCHMSILYTSYSIHTVITKKVTTFSVLHTERPEEWSWEFLDMQVQMGAKGDCNTMQVTIPFVMDLTKHPN